MNSKSVVLFFAASLSLCMLQSCNQTQQQVINSPCTSLNASSQLKPNANLSLLFGNDAIETAINAIAKQMTVQRDTSTDKLTSVGTDAAIRTAKNNGKDVTPQDKAILEKHLREEVIPTVRQNPTCVFNVTSSSQTPYFSVDKIALPPDKSPRITLKNWGQIPGQADVLIRQIVDGTLHSKGDIHLSLGAGQSRELSVKGTIPPISDIQAGKASLMVLIDIQYTFASHFHEAYQYAHAEEKFYAARVKLDPSTHLYYWEPYN